MAGLRFKTKAEPVWVRGDHKVFDATEIGYYSTSERESISFYIYPLTRQLLEDVRKDNTRIDHEVVVVDGRRKIEKIEEVDEDKINDDLLDRILVDWKGILDEDGNEIKCTKQNKLMILQGYPLLAGAWLECSRQIISRYDEFIQKDKEKTLKNSKTSSSGEKS